MPRGPRTGHRYRQALAAVRQRARRGEPCCLCHEPFDPALIEAYPSPSSCSLQHVRQLADGGSMWDPSNHAPAHLVCNSRDGGRRGRPAQLLRPNPSRAW